jgi:hypothetical protein
MEIRFISTLTPEDEENMAPVLLRAATSLLDQTGIAYTLRIETTSDKVFQHNHPAVSGSGESALSSKPLESAMFHQIGVTES